MTALTPVLDGFIQSYEQEKLKENSECLINEATTYFNNFNTRFPNPSVSYTPTARTPTEIVKEIFESRSFQGVCIGELHTHWSPKRVVIDLLPILAPLLSFIGLEHLKGDQIQNLLNRWLEDDNMEMPDELRDALDSVDQKYELPFPFSYTCLVIEAKKAKVPVVALDSSESAIAGVHSSQPLTVKDRIIALNYTAKKTMDSVLQKRPGGFIILTGTKHSSKLAESNIPGLSELMQVPCLIISDTMRFINKNPDIHNNPLSPQKFGFCNEPKTVHSVIIIKKPSLIDEQCDINPPVGGAQVQAPKCTVEPIQARIERVKDKTQPSPSGKLKKGRLKKRYEAYTP